MTLEGQPSNVIPKLKQVFFNYIFIMITKHVWLDSEGSNYTLDSRLSKVMCNCCFVGMVFVSSCKLATLDTFSVPQFSICATAISGLFNPQAMYNAEFVVIASAGRQTN